MRRGSRLGIKSTPAELRNHECDLDAASIPIGIRPVASLLGPDSIRRGTWGRGKRCPEAFSIRRLGGCRVRGELWDLNGSLDRKNFVSGREKGGFAVCVALQGARKESAECDQYRPILKQSAKFQRFVSVDASRFKLERSITLQR